VSPVFAQQISWQNNYTRPYVSTPLGPKFISKTSSITCLPAPPALRLLPPPNIRPFQFEFGARGFYTSNGFILERPGVAPIDFVNDLKLSPNTLTGGIFLNLNFPQKVGFTYSYIFPRLDTGGGTLPAPITIGSTLFTAGRIVTVNSSTQLHRWEIEALFLGNQYASIRPLFTLELWINNLSMRSDGVGAAAVGVGATAPLDGSQTSTKFLMGFGADTHYMPIKNLFLKIKAAYMCLDNSSGTYLDGSLRLFPDQGVYLGVGYQFRQSTFRFDPDATVNAKVQGPYFEFGLLF
jgi:hypothetical protein